MKIYVGNLSYDTTEEALREAFSGYGEVVSTNVITDRDSGRPRGFAFVEMSDQAQGNEAINGLNGQEMDGRTLTVSEARPRPEGGGNRGGNRGGGRRNNW
ncbi:RNA-binding protein [candidate division GN15 bacterium]|nr:RNA-binding protein [candidate division GN15 bacterium]